MKAGRGVGDIEKMPRGDMFREKFNSTCYNNNMTQMTTEEWEASIERVGVVVACLIRDEDKYLLVQEDQPSARGLWNLPAGHVDKDEELEHAAIRETKEETGLDVNIVKELYIYHEKAGKSVKHIYSAEVVGGKLEAQAGEIMTVAWLSFSEVEELNRQGLLRAPWVWGVIREDHLLRNQD
jgi:8-oxo-dGTP diphosphatase